MDGSVYDGPCNQIFDEPEADGVPELMDGTQDHVRDLTLPGAVPGLHFNRRT